jgi:MFS family permease
MTRATDRSEPAQARRAWFTLAVLFGINFMNFYDRQILPVVQEDIRKAWVADSVAQAAARTAKQGVPVEVRPPLSDRDLGWLGTAFILLYAVVGVPLGRLADVWRRTWVLAGGVAVWSLLTAASGMAWNFWSLFACRLGVGVGEASCAPTASSLIGDLFPADRRGRAMALFMLGLPLGLAGGSVLSGAVAQRFGWQAAFYIPLIPGLLLAGAIWMAGESPRGHADPIGPGRLPVSFIESLRTLLSRPTLWWIIVSGAVHNFNTYALGTFLTSVMLRYHELDKRAAGLASGLVWGLGAFGMFAAGWVGDVAFRRRVSGRLEVTCAAIALAVPLVLAGLAVPPGQPWRFTFWLVLTYAMLSAYYGTVYAAIQDIVEPALRGTAMAVYFFAMYMLGAVLGPVATGWLSDMLAWRAAAHAGFPPDAPAALPDGYRAIGLHRAMYVVPILCGVLVFVLWAASRTVAADRARLLERHRAEPGRMATPPAQPANSAGTESSARTK